MPLEPVLWPAIWLLELQQWMPSPATLNTPWTGILRGVRSTRVGGGRPSVLDRLSLERMQIGRRGGSEHTAWPLLPEDKRSLLHSGMR